jgi:hypothetical protein
VEADLVDGRIELARWRSTVALTSSMVPPCEATSVTDVRKARVDGHPSSSRTPTSA